MDNNLENKTTKEEDSLNNQEVNEMVDENNYDNKEETTDTTIEENVADENTKKKKPFDINIIIAVLAASIIEDLIKIKVKFNSQYDILILAVFSVVIYYLLTLIKKKTNAK